MELKALTEIKAFGLLLALLLQSLAGVDARKGFGPGEQDWDYVQVRDGAHLFYWLYYTTANVSRHADRPLVIWLQGGPGVGSTGSGVFEQLGPIDIQGNARDSNWVQHMNVLFIDSPVGAGFSYVEPHGQFALTNKQIAQDLVRLMVRFLYQHQEFQHVPLYIFSESYGGKMAPDFALELYLAKVRGELQCQLKSIVVGNPWTSPLDSVLSYAPYLLQLGIVDNEGYSKISQETAQLARLVYARKWLMATEQSTLIESLIEDITGGVFPYNTMRRMHKSEVYRYGEDPLLRRFMIDNVTQALNLSHMSEWMLQNGVAFDHLVSEICQPAVHIVSRLLNETPVNVGIFSGNMDLLCATPGTVNWINRMNWQRKSEYTDAERIPFRIDGVLEGYEKQGGGLSMFWVFRAGHTVQQDNPTAMSFILRRLTNFG